MPMTGMPVSAWSESHSSALRLEMITSGASSMSCSSLTFVSSRWFPLLVAGKLTKRSLYATAYGRFKAGSVSISVAAMSLSCPPAYTTKRAPLPTVAAL